MQLVQVVQEKSDEVIFYGSIVRSLLVLNVRALKVAIGICSL